MECPGGLAGEKFCYQSGVSDPNPYRDLRDRGAEAGLAVTVLLATYDGAAFLARQLASLAAQRGVAWRLLWRDDGSTDASRALVAEFARTRPGQVVELAGRQRIGVAAAFHALALAAPADACLAFCDQDDEWLPDKLERALAALARVPDGRLALYCARQILIDAAGRPLGGSVPLPRDGARAAEFRRAIAGNIATGCTIVLNPAAAARFRAAPPPAGSLHDWWSYLLVCGAGGLVLVDQHPALRYRQHEGNIVGAPHGRLRRALAALRRGPGVFMTVFRRQLDALAARPDLLTAEARAMAEGLGMALRGGVVARVRGLWRFRPARQTRLETLLFWLWALIG